MKDAHYKALAHYYAAVVHEMLADTFSKYIMLYRDFSVAPVDIKINDDRFTSKGSLLDNCSPPHGEWI